MACTLEALERFCDEKCIYNIHIYIHIFVYSINVRNVPPKKGFDCALSRERHKKN